jgi:uncharacterized coiled-coil DUF342 family protein
MVENLQNESNEKDNIIKTLHADLKEKEEDNKILQQYLDEKSENIESFAKDLGEKEKLLGNRRAQIYQLEQKLSKFNKEQKIYSDQLKDQELKLESAIKNRDELQNEADLIKNQLLNLEEKKQHIESQCSKMEDKMNEKNELVKSLQNTLEKQTKKTGEQEETIVRLQDNIAAQSLQLKDSIKKNDELQLNYNNLIKTLNSKEEKIRLAEDALNRKTSEVSHLETKLRELENQTINTSHGTTTGTEELEKDLKEKSAIIDEYETKILELMIELDELRHK